MIALIDYGAGNTASVANVLEELNCDFKITKREIDITRADRIILPGVGEASFAIRNLAMLNLVNLLRILKKPLLGICLGMQLLCEYTKEGNVAGLGVFPVTCEKFTEEVKVPHMGWNDVELTSSNILFSGIKQSEKFYFANSFYVPNNEFTIATSFHGIEFSAAVCKNNFYGVQFHPEKSGEVGVQIVKNFIENG